MGETSAWKTEEKERDLMHRASLLALEAEGFTAPNPMVGCVIVQDGEIIGEGFHRGPGQPHAEVEALRNAGESARGATVYVTLEPCNHFGRTAPCANALIEAGVDEVVYALADPNPLAAGGADTLNRAGIKTRHDASPLIAEHNRFWLHSVTSDRPYVIAKFAMSLDGKIATSTGDSQWITGPEARKKGHHLRQMTDAIIVGAGTVIADDPSLTVRHGVDRPAHPLRVILDSNGRTSPGAKVFDRTGNGALLACTDAASKAKLDQYREMGVETLALPKDTNGRPDVGDLLLELKTRGANSVMVEGGAETLGSFFDAGLVDEVWAFIAPVVIGGDGKAPIAGLGAETLAHAFRLQDINTEQLGDDLFLRGKTRKENA